MSDEAEKKPETAAQDTPPQAKPQEKKPVPQPPQHNGQHGRIWVLLLVLLIGGGGFYAYTLWQKQANRLAELGEQQMQLRLQLQTQNDDLTQQLNLRLQAMQKEQEALASHFEMLRQNSQHLRKDWLVQESEYLLQMANHRLLFERDVNTAIAALRAADVRLRETGDPAVVSVRKKIAEAIQALKKIPQADLAGLSLTLSAINKELDTLPLKTPDPKSRMDEQQREVATDETVNSWSELPAAVWRDLKKLVIIRDHREPVQPLISPDQRFFLTENLRLQIEQARLAMLSGQGDVYRERIATAIKWIETHFNGASAHTQSTLDTLRQLQAAAIAPDLPDISALLKSMQNLRGTIRTDEPPAAEQGSHS